MPLPKLIVAFENKDLRMACENEDIAKENFGITMLQDRLADINAAESVRDLLVGNPEQTEFESLPAYRINIEKNMVLYFKPNHVKIPCHKNGHVDWDNVSRIIIVAIKKN